MSEEIVLFGAGAAGRYVLSHLRSQSITPACFADSDEFLWNEYIEIPGWEESGGQSHVPIYSPREAKRLHPGATWVACAIQHDCAVEIRASIAALGVKTKPLWECLAVCHGTPSKEAVDTLDYLVLGDKKTRNEMYEQIAFRKNPDYAAQSEPSDIRDIYFPDFIVRREDEHFCDVGACDGDTVADFLQRWPTYAHISAIEPDRENFLKLEEFCRDKSRISLYYGAVGDRDEMVPFVSSGDFSSHLAANGESSVPCNRLDDMDLVSPPTYIKMDIEGAELEALWGARRILKEHSPVLAICAYHTSDHLWQIPLLIHAIQPDYKLFFRRYAEGAFELVWYAVPPERER